jgi:D-3-phosphoglycerate dehydrogenase
VSKPKAVVLAPMRGPSWEQLQELADCYYDPSIEHVPLRMHKEEQLAELVREHGATILVSEIDKVAGPVLEEPLIVVASTRGDPTNVDVGAATAKGIPVLRAPGRNADGVAEITIALMFAASRHVVAGDRAVREGKIYVDGTIPYQRYRAWELNGRTLGIVGFGAIGRALKWRAEGLGMNVITYDPYAADATHDSLDALVAESDVVSLHAPVTEETTGMFGEKQFAAMREGSIFLNAARAYLHDQDALVSALKEGPVAAAGLDHFPHEYLDPASELAQLPNVVLTPHIGGATYDTEANHTRIVVDGIAALLRGERPETIVNPEVLGTER